MNRRDYYRRSKFSRTLHDAIRVFAIFVIILIPIGFLGWKIYHSQTATSVNGPSLSVPQTTATTLTKTFQENTYSFDLPLDWKQVAAINVPEVHSITWQATAKPNDGRWLTIYTDTIPSTMAVNHELPVKAVGNHISFGDVSDNCSNFTAGGTFDERVAVTLKPSPARWEGVDFICNLPVVADDQVGTGSGGNLNSVTVTGPKGGTHAYFFLFIDRSLHPNYSIFLNALQSFQAL